MVGDFWCFILLQYLNYRSITKDLPDLCFKSILFLLNTIWDYNNFGFFLYGLWTFWRKLLFSSWMGTEVKCKNLLNDKFRKMLPHKVIIDCHEIVAFLHWNFSVHMVQFNEFSPKMYLSRLWWCPANSTV